MLSVKVIGVGAAGNKAAIKLVEDQVVSRNDIILLNSTLKDVQTEYKDIAIQVQGKFQGCGKERGIANEMIMDSLRNNAISLDTIMTEQDRFVIIATSTEGGTGSGMSVVMAKYFKEILGVDVHLFGFTGFEDDARGLKNTVDWFKELSPEFMVEAISNKKFLDDSFGNKLKAQEMANDEFSMRVRTLIGKNIVESVEQNIDDTDLLKLTTTAGFMTIENIKLGKIKNPKDFNKVLSEGLDNSKSLDVTASCQRIGVILNIKNKTKDAVDWSFDVLKQRFGETIEFFTHVEDVFDDEELFVVVSGLDMPVEEIEEVYNEFMARIEKVNKGNDDFFRKSFDTNVGSFDMKRPQSSPEDIAKKRNMFFAKVQKVEPVKTASGTAQNITVRTPSAKDNY